MDKTEAVERLQLLIEEIDECELMALDVAAAEAGLEEAKNKHFSYLADFDKDHKEEFIKKRAGDKPKKPKLTTIINVPVYRSQKDKYKKEKAAYKERLSGAEDAYKEEYFEERNKLKEQDAAEREKVILDAEKTLESAKSAYAAAQDAFDHDDLLSVRMKSIECARKLLEFFEDGRVDTLKEAINLWFEEKRKDEEEARAEAYRREMKELEEERVRAAQSAEEYARQAADNAREAADMAHQREWDKLMYDLED